MNILGFDTTGSACSVALLRGDAIAASRLEMMTRGHAEALMPMILDVLADADARFDDVDALAVTVGPGSFTGLRVGLSAARGMSLACGLPVVGATTLETVAHGERDNGGWPVMSAMETKRADVYVQIFSKDGEALSEPMALMPEDIVTAAPSGPLTIVGDAAERARASFDPTRRDIRVSDDNLVVDARELVRLAHGRVEEGGVPDRSPPTPLYIHPPRATIPADQGRLRP